MGRSKSDNPKNDQVHYRLTHEEAEKIDAAVDVSSRDAIKRPTRNDWARWAAIRMAEKVLAEAEVDRKGKR